METDKTLEPPNPLGPFAGNYNRSASGHHHHARAILIIVVAVASTLLVSVILVLVAKRRRLRPAKCRGIGGRSTGTNGKFITQTAMNFTYSPDLKGTRMPPPERYRGVQVFTIKELEEATNGFSEANVIRNGGFGVVYRGVLSDGTVAAVKVLHKEAGKQGERAFRIEVDLLSGLHCPFLVELVGYCADQNQRILIFEFMPNGTLDRQLHSCCGQALDWGTRLGIALDCARALEYLHDHAAAAPVIHRDFNCTNILLDQNFRAKVSDFGLAKMGSQKINGLISTRVLGTTGYLAPEYASTGKLTTKSDVYSYGVVLLELLTGRVPVDTNRPPGEHVLVSWALPRLTNREKVEEMVDPALRGQYSKKDLIQVAAIAAVCVQAEADYRPLMTDVVQSLIPLAKNLSLISNSASLRFQNKIASPKSCKALHGNPVDSICK